MSELDDFINQFLPRQNAAEEAIHWRSGAAPGAVVSRRPGDSVWRRGPCKSGSAG